MAAVKKTYCKNGVTKNKTLNGKNEKNLCWTFKRNKTIAVFAEHLETFCFFVQENNCSYYFQFFKIMNPVRIYLMDMIIPLLLENITRKLKHNFNSRKQLYFI